LRLDSGASAQKERKMGQNWLMKRKEKIKSALDALVTEAAKRKEGVKNSNSTKIKQRPCNDDVTPSCLQVVRIAGNRERESKN